MWEELGQSALHGVVVALVVMWIIANFGTFHDCVRRLFAQNLNFDPAYLRRTRRVVTGNEAVRVRDHVRAHTRRIVTGNAQTKVRDHVRSRLRSLGDEVLQDRRLRVEKLRRRARALRMTTTARLKQLARGDMGGNPDTSSAGASRGSLRQIFKRSRLESGDGLMPLHTPVLAAFQSEGDHSGTTATSTAGLLSPRSQAKAKRREVDLFKLLLRSELGFYLDVSLLRRLAKFCVHGPDDADDHTRVEELHFNHGAAIIAGGGTVATPSLFILVSGAARVCAVSGRIDKESSSGATAAFDADADTDVDAVDFDTGADIANKTAITWSRVRACASRPLLLTPPLDCLAAIVGVETKSSANVVADGQEGANVIKVPYAALRALAAAEQPGTDDFVHTKALQQVMQKLLARLSRVTLLFATQYCGLTHGALALTLTAASATPYLSSTAREGVKYDKSLRSGRKKTTNLSPATSLSMYALNRSMRAATNVLDDGGYGNDTIAEQYTSFDTESAAQCVADALEIDAAAVSPVIELSDGSDTCGMNAHAVQLLRLEAGALLSDSHAPTALPPAAYVVLSGTIEIIDLREEAELSEANHFMPRDAGVIFAAQAGDIVGLLEILSSSWTDWFGVGGSRFVRARGTVPTTHETRGDEASMGGGTSPALSMRASTDVQVARLELRCVERLRKTCPALLSSYARRIIRVLANPVNANFHFPESVKLRRLRVLREAALLRMLDASTRTVRYRAGEVVSEANERSGGLRVVVHGRLRAAQSGVGGAQWVEWGRGAVLGASQLLAPRSTYGMTVHAVRDTQLSFLPTTAVLAVARRDANAMLRLGRTICESILSSNGNAEGGGSAASVMTQVSARRSPRTMHVPNASDSCTPRVRGDAGVRSPRMHACRSDPSRRWLSAQSVNGGISGVRRVVIAVVPASASVPFEAFCDRLDAALSATCSGGADGLADSGVKRLTSSVAAGALGLTDSQLEAALGGTSDNDLDGWPVSDSTVMSWLEQQEQLHTVLLYQADAAATAWSQTCVRGADVVLLVASADDPSRIDPHTTEGCMLDRHGRGLLQITNARRELVLLHSVSQAAHSANYTYHPSMTRQHISARALRSAPVHHHHHVRCGDFADRKSIDADGDELNSDIGRIDNTHPVDHSPDSDGDECSSWPHLHQSDFGRLSRWLTGTSIGLVLGGGGARGAAHLGVLRALEDAGIPVDYIGGTSIGSFVGASYALDDSYLRIKGRFAHFCREMGSLWNMICDLTWPTSSYFTGAAFNRAIAEMLGGTKIEDFWLPYFCVTTDLKTSSGLVHANGTAWRYVRASMTLAGYLPPVCDGTSAEADVDLHLLVDGGYVNNMPADVMQRMLDTGGTGGQSTIISVDVSSGYELKSCNYGDRLQGGWMLLKRLTRSKINPRNWTIFGGSGDSENQHAADLIVPSISEINSQLAYVSSVKQFEDAKKISTLFLNPPVKSVGTLQWDVARQTEMAGFEYATREIAKWKRELQETQDFRLRFFRSSHSGTRPSRRASEQIQNGLRHRVASTSLLSA